MSIGNSLMHLDRALQELNEAMKAAGTTGKAKRLDKAIGKIVAVRYTLANEDSRK